jgi:hypothetical protein
MKQIFLAAMLSLSPDPITLGVITENDVTFLAK